MHAGADVTRPQKTRGYCLSVADDCLCCCCCCRTIARLDSLVGGEGGQKKPKQAQKDKGKARMSSSRWQQRGRDSSAARAMPDPLLTVECFSSLRSQKFSMESGLPRECVLRPQRSREWSWQNKKKKRIPNTHAETVTEPATVKTSLNPQLRPACILELTVKNMGDKSTKGRSTQGARRYGNLGAETSTTEASICLKGPRLDYHRVNTRYHRCTHLHGTLNITVHQLSGSLT